MNDNDVKTGAERDALSRLVTACNYLKEVEATVDLKHFDALVLEVTESFEKAIQSDPSLKIDVSESQLSIKEFRISKSESSSVYPLYLDGIRALIIKKGVTTAEIKRLLGLLSHSAEEMQNQDEDFYCLFKENAWSYIEISCENLWAVGAGNQSEKYSRFKSQILKKERPHRHSLLRRLRADDLKVLDEFRFNSQIFSKSSDEISRSVKALTVHSKIERDLLDRLLEMGFFFLQSKADLDRRLVGREIVSKALLSALEGGVLDILDASISRIQRVQKENPQQSGELQKILDFIFSSDHVPLYQNLLNQPDHQAPLHSVFQKAPPSSIRLFILLLGTHPWIEKSVSDLVFRQIGDQMNWLSEQVFHSPGSPAWEQLVVILSSRPTYHLSKFLEIFFRSGERAGQSKILKVISKESPKLLEKLTERSPLSILSPEVREKFQRSFSIFREEDEELEIEKQLEQEPEEKKV